MENQEPQTTITFVDDPHAPELFASETAGYFVNDGVVRVTFASARINHVASPGPINRVVVGRLVMSVAAAQALALGLYDFLKKQGFDPAPLPSKDQLQ